MIEPVEFGDQLKALGVSDGSWLMVHASLRKLRSVRRGGIGVIDALMHALGEHGTLVMMIAAEDGTAFAPDTTPATAENGALCEVFRTYPGVRVNDNPACRFAALGPHAETFLFPQPQHDYYGPGSPLSRLYDADGWVLRLGADIDTVTLTHYAEYVANVADKIRVTRHYDMVKGESVAIESLDDTDGIKQWRNGDYFPQILRDYLSAGHADAAVIEGCPVELLRARDFVDFAVSWMERELNSSPTTSVL